MALNKDIMKRLQQHGNSVDILSLFDTFHSQQRAASSLFEILVFQAMEIHPDFVNSLLDESNQARVTLRILQMLLCGAVKQDDTCKVDDLLSRGATADDEGFIHTQKGKVMTNPLRCAIAEDNVTLLDKLLHHCKFTTRTKDERTPIHLVLLHNSPKCREFVLTNSETLKSINSSDKRGETPLMIAASKHPGLIPKLLQLGAGPNLAKPKYSRKGKDILHVLCSTDFEETQNGYDFIQLCEEIIAVQNTSFEATNMRESVLCALCNQIKRNVLPNLLRTNIQIQNESSNYESLQIFVLGCELKQCIAYICSIAPASEVEFGIRGAIDQIFYVLNLRQIQSDRSTDLQHYVQQLPVVLGYILETVQIMTRYKQTYNIQGISSIDMIVRTLLTMECSNAIFFTDLKIAEVYRTKAVMIICKILKHLLLFKDHRKLNDTVKMAELLTFDSQVYDKLLDEYLHNLDFTSSNSVLNQLTLALDKVSRQNTERARNYINTKLRTVPSLKHSARKVIIYHVGGDLNINNSQSLPIPKKLLE